MGPRMRDCFIINGTVIDPARDVRGKMNCIVRDGKIAEWTQARAPIAGVVTIDARGAIVCPGLIDLHVHLRDPGEEYKEDIVSGAAAAAAGGFTSVVCMANTTPTNDCASVTRYIVDRARQARGARVYPVGAISRGLAGKELADIGDMASEGAVAISDDGKTVANAQLMRRAMQYANDFGLPVLTHCEDPDLCKDTVMNESAVSTQLGLRGRPNASESIIVHRDIALAELTNTRLHIQHVSTGAAVEQVRLAKATKLRVTTEVTPHHLFLADRCLCSFDPVYKMNPPLRSDDDIAALRRGLRDGTIDCIATDHAPHACTDKDEMPIETASCGVIGIECALAISLKLVTERVVSLARLIALFTSEPARILNLPRGRLGVGDEADITIFDPKHAVTIRAADFLSKSRNCPFEGWHCHGKVLWTIVGGEVVWSRA